MLDSREERNLHQDMYDNVQSGEGAGKDGEDSDKETSYHANRERGGWNARTYVPITPVEK